MARASTRAHLDVSTCIHMHRTIRTSARVCADNALAHIHERRCGPELERPQHIRCPPGALDAGTKHSRWHGQRQGAVGAGVLVLGRVVAAACQAASGSPLDGPRAWESKNIRRVRRGLSVPRRGQRQPRFAAAYPRGPHVAGASGQSWRSSQMRRRSAGVSHERRTATREGRMPRRRGSGHALGGRAPWRSSRPLARSSTTAWAWIASLQLGRPARGLRSMGPDDPPSSLISISDPPRRHKRQEPCVPPGPLRAVHVAVAVSASSCSSASGMLVEGEVQAVLESPMASDNRREASALANRRSAARAAPARRLGGCGPGGWPRINNGGHER